MPEGDPRVVAAEAEAPPPPPPAATRRRRPPPPPAKKSRAVLVGWVLLLLFVVGAAAGGWFGRQEIVAQFPQLTDVYALVGVPLAPAGPTLDLSDDVDIVSDEIEGDTVITIRGEITNISDRKQQIPTLRAQLTNADGEVVAEWTFEPPQSELDAGAALTYETGTKNPPEGARDLGITFVESDH